MLYIKCIRLPEPESEPELIKKDIYALRNDPNEKTNLQPQQRHTDTKKTGGEPPSKMTDELLRKTMYAAHTPMSNVNENDIIKVTPNYGDAFTYTHTHKIQLEKNIAYYIPIPPINEGGFGKIYNYDETMVLKVTCKKRCINDSLHNELRMNTLIQKINCKKYC